MPLASTTHELRDHDNVPSDGATALALENQRLRESLAERDLELRAQRVRLVEVIDEERRRVERNLHDGAQQQLVAIALKLNMTLARIDSDLALGAELIGEAVDDLMRTTDSLRDLAIGLHPPALADGGLDPALEELQSRFPLPVQIVSMPAKRMPSLVESTIYYVVTESLANVAKHARADNVEIAVSLHGGIATVEVRDDGIGNADPAGGSGLRGLAERLSALGGRLDVLDVLGGGTLVRATMRAADPV
ncbi:MAG: hypothetical protein HY827_09065 [Actinobacteria bacterium]|nr:hypothetical protein [Actinomycetota bacterium]